MRRWENFRPSRAFLRTAQRPLPRRRGQQLGERDFLFRTPRLRGIGGWKLPPAALTQLLEGASQRQARLRPGREQGPHGFKRQVHGDGGKFDGRVGRNRVRWRAHGRGRGEGFPFAPGAIVAQFADKLRAGLFHGGEPVMRFRVNMNLGHRFADWFVRVEAENQMPIHGAGVVLELFAERDVPMRIQPVWAPRREEEFAAP